MRNAWVRSRFVGLQIDGNGVVAHCALSPNQMPPAKMASESALSMDKFLSQTPGFVSSSGSGQMGLPSFLSRPAGMRLEP